MVGDQNPPSYPVVNVHVAEPVRGPLQKKWEAEDDHVKQAELDDVGKRLTSQRDFLVGSMGALRAKTQLLAKLAETVLGVGRE